MLGGGCGYVRKYIRLEDRLPENLLLAGLTKIDLFTVWLGGGGNTAKITVNVWDSGPLVTAITLLQKGRFPQRKCI